MIPICTAPKRFPAALAPAAFVATRIQQIATLLPKNSIAISEVARTFSTSKIPPINYSKSFSTVMDVEPKMLPRIEIQYNPELLQRHRTNPTIAHNINLKPKSKPGNLNLYGTRSAEWWTGKVPFVNQFPGLNPLDRKLYSMPQITFQDGKCTKQSIQNYFDNTWTLTEMLLSSLQGEEAFQLPPLHGLRHPMIFYYGHPAALYINKLRVAGLLKEPVNQYFEIIFETGVDEMSWDDLSNNKMPWPTVDEVHAYRKKVYHVVSNVIQNLTEEQCSSINQQSPLWALFMGFEHERIHLETSSFLISEMPIQHVKFPVGFPSYHSSITTSENAKRSYNPQAGVDYPFNEMISVNKTTVSIGKPTDFPSFGWDNEYGHREFSLPEFKASKFKITNGEFLEFIKDGGYSRNELWSEIGWKWRAGKNAKWPQFWVRTGPQGYFEFDLRIMFDVVPMPWSHPVTVNYHEAAAFANWKMLKASEANPNKRKVIRVMSEVEHRAIRDQVVPPSSETYEEDPIVKHAGNDIVQKMGYNTNLSYSSTSPVNALPANSKGFHDVFGNAWEWTTDYFSALPGFQVHPYYEDFSTPCFDGKHHVIQGGSFISTGNEASFHSRFHFRPHFHQHASFRIVEQLNDVQDVVDLRSDQAGTKYHLTTDTDAPGPYVGSYPFRRSDNKREAEINQLANEIVKKNDIMSLHYGFFQNPMDPSSTKQHPLASVKEMILKQNQLHNQSIRMTKFSNKAAEVSFPDAKVLEVGCEVGGLTALLAKHFHSINGIDHHQEWIDSAKQLFNHRKPLRYELAAEGNTKQSFTVLPPSFTSDNMATESSSDEPLQHKQITFRCADPMCLPAEMKHFDVVILNNVLTKVSSPNSVLSRLGGVRGLVQPNGLLYIIESGFHWNEMTTPASLWLGGYQDPVTQTVIRSEDSLIQRLSEDFSLVHQEELPVFWTTSSSDIRGKIHNVLVFRRHNNNL